MKQRLTIYLEAQLIISIQDIKDLKNGSDIFLVIRNRFEYKNPKFIENEKWGYSNYGIPKKLLTYITDDEGNIRIARGGKEKLEQILGNFDVECNFIDRMLVLPTIHHKTSNLTLREDQEEFVQEMLKHNQGSSMCFTSFGKTLANLELWRRIGQPGLIIVHTTFLQEQWIQEATNPKTFNLDPQRIGGVGGIFKGKRKLGDLNICLYHSLSKEDHLEFFMPRVGFVFFDEGQKSPIEDVSNTVNNFRAKYRYTSSANLKRKDGKEFITFDTFGPVRYIAEEKNGDSKILSLISLVPTSYYDQSYDDNRNFSQFITKASRDQKRNILICRRAIKKIREGKLVLIMVERKEHAAVLYLMLSKFKGDLLLGGGGTNDATVTNKKVLQVLKDYEDDTAYKRISKLAKTKKLQFIIGTQKAEVGLSIRTIDHAIITTPTGNNLERFNQQKGRVERTYDEETEVFFGHKKPVPTIDVLVDDNDISQRAANRIKEKYKNHVSWLKKDSVNKVILKKREIE